MRIALAHNLRRGDDEGQRGFTSGAEVDELLESMGLLGHHPVPVEVGGTLDETLDLLRTARPDLVFNLAEGWVGPWRQSFHPALYERLGLPYTGSGPAALGLALDKHLTKLVLSARHIPTPGWAFADDAADLPPLEHLRYPVIVKPNFESCSKGIGPHSLADTARTARALLLETLRDYPHGVLVEEYVPGRDITVPYFTAAGGALTPAETTMPATRAPGGLFDYTLKQDPARWSHLRVPAALPAALADRARALTRTAVRALGLHDFARADFRLSPDGALHLLEVNGLPGLPAGGASHRAAVLAGLDPATGLAGAVITSAAARLRLPAPPPRPR
ncbi:D-alanine--D-alanine ligase family protein [Streptomyces subrutilus]|uniref:D-alanine--D-alanine ligase family protein n=1 Tax=Streptomyces subrutilus TaxID=36818 RepID=UPI0033F9CE34